MTVQARAIVDEVLLWPPSERAGLIETLLSSFDAEARKIVDAAWVRESESRIDAYETGQIHSMPLAEVANRINKK